MLPITSPICRFLMVLLVGGGLATSAVAVEKFTFTTLDGQEIVDATFSRRMPDGVSFMTREGVRKINFKYLPPEMRKRFRYDEGEAEAYRKRREVEAEEKREAARKAELERREERDRMRLLPKDDVTLSGRVLRVMDGGVLLTGAKATRPGFEQRARQVQTDGPTKLSPHRKRSYRTVVEKVEIGVPLDLGTGVVFLVDEAYSKVALDGQRYTADVFPIGRYRYTDNLGLERTVARFTTEPGIAAAYAAAQLEELKKAEE